MRSRTGKTPEPSAPSATAAARDTSRMRVSTNGPRSLMRTRTDRFVARLSTCSHVPNGSVRCAAVIAFMSKTSPFAVRRP
jgi:hypothetical protein